MPKYFDFEVSLNEIEPKLWRQFLLRDTSTFAHLHEAIQDACGWEYDHLFEFEAGRGRQKESIAGIPSDEMWGEPVPDASRVRLASFFTRANMKCEYLYDFGDCWRHTVRLKRLVESEEKFRRRLVGGERAFPSEDSGGIWGYYRCLAAVGKIEPGTIDIDPQDLEEAKEWVGDWDPDAFDLAKAAKRFDK
jgi:hypothetical protein